MQRAVSAPSEYKPSGTIPSELALTREFVSRSIHGLRSLRLFSPENAANFAPGSIVRIPVVSPNFLDLNEARLAFDFVAGTATSVKFDNGAHCLIKRLQVLAADGTELERIESYNLIHCIKTQYENTWTDHLDDAMSSGAARPGFTAMSALVPLHSDILSGDVMNATIQRHFELRLRASGWFNPTLKRLLPPGTPFTLVLTLAEGLEALVIWDNTAGVASSNVAYTFKNVFLKVPVVSVSDPAFMDLLQNLRGRGYQWTSETWKIYTNTWASSGTQVMTINDRSLSLKALIGCMRQVSRLGVGVEAELSRRSIQALTDYQYQIGTDLYPPQKIDINVGLPRVAVGTAVNVAPYLASTDLVNMSQVWAEAQRVFGSKGLIDPVSFCGSDIAFTAAAPMVAGGMSHGVGLFCIDCTAYHVDKRSTSGLNTAENAVPITLRATTNSTTHSASIQVDIIARIDCTFILQPNGSLRVAA